MATRIITPAEQTRLENLARGLHKQGAETAKIAAITGLSDDEIAKAITAPATAAAPAPPRSAPPARPIPPSPVATMAGSSRPITSPRTEEPRAEDRTVEALLRRAEQATPALCKKADRLREQIALLWSAVGEHDSKVAAERQADQEKERARIAVEEAKRALAQALAMAKEAGVKVGLKSTTSGDRPRVAATPASPETVAKRRAGLIKAHHARGQHTRKPNPDCAQCAEEAGGGV